MTDFEWVNKALSDFQAQEIEALGRLKEARENWAKAKAELASAKEYLEGARVRKRNVLPETMPGSQRETSLIFCLRV